MFSFVFVLLLFSNVNQIDLFALNSVEFVEVKKQTLFSNQHHLNKSFLVYVQETYHSTIDLHLKIGDELEYIFYNKNGLNLIFEQMNPNTQILEKKN